MFSSGKVFLLLAGLLFAGRAEAQQFVFEFKNPAFGGSYLNYSWLLQSAEAQKEYKEKSTSSSSFNRDPLADFQQSLQRQILSALSRELISDRFRDLDLTKEGRYDLGDYIINIVPGLTGVDVTIFNVLTGAETTVTIPNY